MFYLLFRLKNRISNFFLIQNLRDDGNNKASRFKYFVFICFLITAILLMSIFWNQTYNLLLERYRFFKKIPVKLEHELLGKADYYESLHQLNTSLRYYKLYVNHFPDADKKFVNSKIEKLEEKINFSSEYFRLANIDTNSEKFSRQNFLMLSASLKINPENAEVIDLIKIKIDHLKYLSKQNIKFHKNICEKDFNVVEKIINDYGWYLMEDQEIPAFSEKNKKRILNYKEFVCAFEPYEFAEYIEKSWRIDSISNLLKWAQEMKRESASETFEIKY